jgi:hypothetical protein
MINLKGKELTKFIKLQLLKYWRFDRQYIFCCTEGINNSDINAINNKYLIEVEIKISKSDFLSEFNGKSRIKSYKHKIYSSFLTKNAKIKPKKGYIIPNYYYFCTTNELKNVVLEYINEFYPKYGLLICDTHRQFNKKSNIICVKKPKLLTEDKPNLNLFFKIGKRIQNELITLKEKYF